MIKCPKCQSRWNITPRVWPVHCVCGHAIAETDNNVSADKPVSAARKAINYAAESSKWIAAGMPERTDAEVARLAAICHSCEHLVEGACSKCGCPIQQDAPTWRNKLKMGSSSCPIEKW